mgnify:CR=1 FL=1
MNTFNNTTLYPDTYDYFYVVAEAVESITNDGFGIVYPQLNNYFYEIFFFILIQYFLFKSHSENELHTHERAS